MGRSMFDWDLSINLCSEHDKSVQCLAIGAYLLDKEKIGEKKKQLVSCCFFTLKDELSSVILFSL